MRHSPGFLACFLYAAWLAGATAVAGQSPGPSPVTDDPFTRCRLIKDDAARLHCYEDANSAAGSPGRTSVAGTWRLVRTPNPAGGRDAVSIMQTADVSRSDIDLAGLMIRCGETAIEVLVVLVQPLSLRAHPEVRIDAGAASVRFTASVVPPGALVLLPPEATALAAGAWQAAPELTVAVTDKQITNRGVIPLNGLGAALQALRVNCPP